MRGPGPGLGALLAARRTGKPFVTTYHGAYGEVEPIQGRLQQRDGAGRPRHRQFALHGVGDRSA